MLAAAGLGHRIPQAWAGLFAPAVPAQAPQTLYPQGPLQAGNSAPRFELHLLADRNGPLDDISKVPAQGGWLNSTALDLAQLQADNKVVLLDFWAYTCINCIRANAFTEELWQRYRDHGLVVIGVHSLEFDIGGSPQNILAAVERQGLTYPILTDSDMFVWREFNNRYWPAVYLIDAGGDIVYHKFGEGNYAHEEQVVRAQLQKAGYQPPAYGPPNPPEQLVPVRRTQTPELYAGPDFLRRPYGNDQQPRNGQTIEFDLPDSGLQPDRIYLAGAWRGAGDYVESESTGRIALDYQAQAAYLVLATNGEAHTVTVTLDGKPVPPAFRGEDVHVDNGTTVMTVDQPRLYAPIAHRGEYGRHTIEFQVPPGIRLYSFTFGTYEP
ncbi:MAG TPA: redoxin domain-containing protein [Salinisphaeraceae bacterium]|nr:redoxin domain-containing protein [Salinisphaeraceae bacterium]